VKLDGDWKPLGATEAKFLEDLTNSNSDSGECKVRGQTYRFDRRALTQTNVASGRARPIRFLATPAEAEAEAPAAPLAPATPAAEAEAPATPPATAGAAAAASSAVANPVTVSEASTEGRSAAAARFRRTAAAAKLCTLPKTTRRFKDAPSSPAAKAAPPDRKCVEVWLAGEWKRLGEVESAEIARRQAAGESVFEIAARGTPYAIDLNQMTQTNKKSGRTRTIRVVDSDYAIDESSLGFDQFRTAFHKVANGCAGLGDQKGSSEAVTEKGLLNSWPLVEENRKRLARATAAAVLKEMTMRGKEKADMMEWIHYWALERDSPSYHAGREVNEKLAQELKLDQQVLGRMQMHFETAVCEDSSGKGSGGLSAGGLLRACQRLASSPKDVVEKQWAKEVLEQHKKGDGPEEDAELTYYDFLNVMLGRKKFKVSLWMYDISDGRAKRWSWMLLGHHFEGIWHTGVVVEWPTKTSEFWFGGSLFESQPGTTPFGQPVEKRFLGYTYKLPDEAWNYLARTLATEFTKANYDVLTHNCNHFSEKFCLFLRNEHIPDEVLRQPDMVMSTITARALRPLLNRWLGGFGDQEGRATDGGEEANKLWDSLQPGAMITFAREEGGRPMVGELRSKGEEECWVTSLDLHGSTVDRFVPRALVLQLLQPPPPGFTPDADDSALWEQRSKSMGAPPSCPWPLSICES